MLSRIIQQKKGILHMKRILALTLALALLLGGCGAKETPSAADAPALNGAVTINDPNAVPTEVTEEPTEAPTTVPTTEPKVYFNPLNGEILDAPFDGRLYAVSICNTNDGALPHVNLINADVVFESFVNYSVIRCLALYTNFEEMDSIGSTRSARLMFNDIAEHYNLVFAHAGGVNRVIRDANERGLDHFNVDSLMRQADDLAKGTAYRSKDYPKQKYGEFNLFTSGPGVMAYAESQGVQLTGMPETDYGLTFLEDGTPVDGEEAGEVTVTITYNKYKKKTTMVYDPEKGQYVFHQYDKVMKDLISEEEETFENVVIMYTNMSMKREFEVADFVAGGGGYYACGGRIIPITWTCEDEKSPFRFFTADGQPLSFGQGKSYIAITEPDSKVVWSA